MKTLGNSFDLFCRSLIPAESERDNGQIFADSREHVLSSQDLTQPTPPLPPNLN